MDIGRPTGHRPRRLVEAFSSPDSYGLVLLLILNSRSETECASPIVVDCPADDKAEGNHVKGLGPINPNA